jgi:hypothetical protein
MIKPRCLPPNSYIDDPADKLDPVDPAESESNETFSKLGVALVCIFDWITRGRNTRKQRAMRLDTVIQHVKPQFLACQRPNAAWVAREHGVSREWTRLLKKQFNHYIKNFDQSPRQRSRNLENGSAKRRGRVRRGTQGPPPGPVAGA